MNFTEHLSLDLLQVSLAFLSQTKNFREDDRFPDEIPKTGVLHYFPATSSLASDFEPSFREKKSERDLEQVYWSQAPLAEPSCQVFFFCMAQYSGLSNIRK